MPVDPEKLKSYAEGDGQMGEEPMPAPEEAEQSAGADLEALVPTLEAHIKEIQVCCDEMDADVLRDPTKPMRSADELIMRQGFEDLDDELKAALRDAGELTPAEGHEVASMLFDKEAIQDPYRIAGWLTRASAIAAAYKSDEEAESEKEDAEDADDEDEDLDEDMDDEDLE